MHIVMLSDTENGGGAAIAAGRLAAGLSQIGHRVTRVVAAGEGRSGHWQLHRLGPDVLHGGMRLVREVARQISHEGWERRRHNHMLDRVLTELHPDLINVHNLHAGPTGWTWEMVDICREHAPTVWTLHDMWSFTGRCAYAYDCRKYLSSCDHTCPTAQEQPALAPKLIQPAWESRRQTLANHADLAAVAPSRWLAQAAGAGLWAGHPVHVVPNGVPLSVYQPLDRDLARQAMDIRAHGPVLLAVAQNWDERRKGGACLIEALRALRQKVTLVLLGHGQPPEIGPHVRVHMLGYVDHERSKALAYSAADLLVHPAPVDNLPNVVVEALACGTPVVAFPTGGLPEMVCPGETGWLAPDISADALRRTLAQALLELSDGLNLRNSCRAVACRDYCQLTQARKHMELFDQMCAGTVVQAAS